MKNQIKSCTGNEKGSTLLVVIMILLALTGIAMGVSTISVGETQLASNEKLDKEVFYLAEAGIEQSLWKLSELTVPFTGAGANKDQPVEMLSDVEMYDKGTVTSYIDPLDSNNGSKTRFVNVTVRATLSGTGMTKVLQVKVGQQNFSRYAYFSDQEKSASGGTIWFYDNDEFHGPVHTNDQMHIYGDPEFFDETSSSASDVDYYHGGPPQDDPKFHGGLTLDASRIDLPTDTGMLLNAASEPGGLRLNGNPARIEFYVSGSTPLIRVIIGGTTTIHNYPANGVIYVTGRAEVKGRIKGQVTVGCSDDIYITDNLIYDTDPRTDPTSTDLCGLVAEGNVQMADNTANRDSADETIMAAIMALDTSWGVQNYSSGSPRGELVVYGGIIQNRRGAVGTFGSSGIRSGYSKDYHYDSRLMDTPPPAFPTTGQVEKIAWNEIDPSTDISLNFW